MQLTNLDFSNIKWALTVLIAQKEASLEGKKKGKGAYSEVYDEISQLKVTLDKIK